MKTVDYDLRWHLIVELSKDVWFMFGLALKNISRQDWDDWSGYISRAANQSDSHKLSEFSFSD